MLYYHYCTTVLPIQLLEKEKEKDDDEAETVVCFKEFSKICSEVLDNFLYLSGQEVASNYDILRAKGITHVVNAAAEICECYFPDKLKYLALNLRDNPNEVSNLQTLLSLLLLLLLSLYILLLYFTITKYYHTTKTIEHRMLLLR